MCTGSHAAMVATAPQDPSVTNHQFASRVVVNIKIAVVGQMAHAMIVTPAMMKQSVHHVEMSIRTAAVEKVARAMMATFAKSRTERLSANPVVVTISPAVADWMEHATSKVMLAMRRPSVHHAVETTRSVALWTRSTAMTATQLAVMVAAHAWITNASHAEVSTMTHV